MKIEPRTLPRISARSLPQHQKEPSHWPQETLLLSSDREPEVLLLPPPTRTFPKQEQESSKLSPEEQQIWRDRFGPDPLQLGSDKEEAVKHLQDFLNQRELTSLLVDGDFGSMTRLAVLCAQERLGLEQSGIFDEVTREALLQADKYVQDPLKLTPMEREMWAGRFGPEPLKRGQDNVRVRHLQTFLNQRERLRLLVDGDFGPSTETAVKATQKRLGLEETGVVDETTKLALLHAARVVPEGGNGHDAVKARIQEALHQEHNFFGGQTIDASGRITKQGRKEYETGFDTRIGDYWTSIGLRYDGDDRDIPWSAAFISYVHKESGVGPQFKAGPAHASYIRDSISAKREGREDAAYWGHRTSERAPQVGDLIGRARQSGVDYDNQPEFYKSHTDIVVEVGQGYVDMIGGNVGDSVTRTRVSTDAEGFVVNRQRYFVVMEPKNLSGPEEARNA